MNIAYIMYVIRLPLYHTAQFKRSKHINTNDTEMVLGLLRLPPYYVYQDKDVFTV